MTWNVPWHIKRGWLQAAEACATNDNLFAEFRRHALLITVVASEQHDPALDRKRAEAYWKLVELHEDIKLCNHELRNIDKIGDPITWNSCNDYSREILRYLHTLFDMNEKTGVFEGKVIELGGGFGGQAAIHCLMNDHERYTIVDYHEAGLLQKRFCREAGFNITTLRAESFDCKIQPEYDLFVSNYSFDELPLWQQKHYVTIAQRCKHGYVTANAERGRVIELLSPCGAIKHEQERESIGTAEVIWW